MFVRMETFISEGIYGEGARVPPARAAEFRCPRRRCGSGDLLVLKPDNFVQADTQADRTLVRFSLANLTDHMDRWSKPNTNREPQGDICPWHPHPVARFSTALRWR